MITGLEEYNRSFFTLNAKLFSSHTYILGTQPPGMKCPHCGGSHASLETDHIIFQILA
jgi:hypothetical protein